ncbi:hypothetical protein ACQKP5_20955 [Pseudomonas vancouverensis]|uniref:hypothetical protein n=1 Tax=Pseudomonas vancouverensis TaxID=95300 RepID=UPI003CFC219B
MNYLFPLSLLITIITGIATVTINQTTGVYDSSHDSIALPIIAFLLIFSALTTTYLAQLFFQRKTLKSRIGKRVLLGISGLSAALSLLTLIANAIYWWLPNHTIISLLFCITTAVFIYNQISLYRKA